MVEESDEAGTLTLSLSRLSLFTGQHWLVWLSGLSMGLRTKGSPVRFPVRAHAWVVGQVPSGGHMIEATTH